MSDRELLEWAAKAIGVHGAVFHDWPGMAIRHGYASAMYLPEDGYWNPLEDDGDALRLAVKLGIHLTNSGTDAWASDLVVTAIEPLNGDPYAATRRAIVRAAAAIGKGGE